MSREQKDWMGGGVEKYEFVVLEGWGGRVERRSTLLHFTTKT